MKPFVLILTLALVALTPAPGHGAETFPVTAAEPEAASPLQVLTRLMDARLALMPAVARHKWVRGGAIEDPKREAEVVAAFSRQARAAGVPELWAAHFMRAQIEAAKAYQRALFSRWQQGRVQALEPGPDLAREVRPQLDQLGRDMVRALAAAWPELAAGPRLPPQLVLAEQQPYVAFLALAPLREGSLPPLPRR